MRDASFHTHPDYPRPPLVQQASQKDNGLKFHSHYIGVRNRDGRYPGFTNDGDLDDNQQEELMLEEFDQHSPMNWVVTRSFTQAVGADPKWKTVRNFMEEQTDDHLKHPVKYPMSFRAVLHTTEAWIKTDQFKEGHSLVGNVVVNHDEGGRGMKVDEDKIQMAQTEGDEFIQSSLRGRSAKHENMYTRKSNTSTIRTVNQTTSPNADSVSSDPAQRLLDAIKKDREQIDSLQNYDGKGQSPVASADFPTRIDEADQFTEDNWIARSQDLIRNAGKLPMNAEPKLDKLFGAGLVTPNALHYVRNHGAVPHLLWDTHKLSVLWGQTKDFSMDSLKQDFHPINIPVVFACDGNRRKELNMILRSKGFDWGPAAVSCAYWKGALLRDVLLKAQGSEAYPREGGPRLWVHFEGAETLPQGKYGTSIPLDHVMDPTNDVLLAYEMNDALLPPDHGFPLRVIIPGHVGGRLVKWLSKIWVSDKESDNWYHLNDNRVLPPFIKDGDSDAAKAYFQHPDSACYEQNLNSVIAKPGLNEQVPLKDIAAKATYRVQGYAYNGGGQEIQRVEISLDGGRNWQFCVRQFPKNALRHDKKFWSWVHWYADVDTVRLLGTKGIAVRAFNVNKNTQPENPNWNLTGMMNNCWYTVKPQIQTESSTCEAVISFLHPTGQGIGSSGWMQNSCENQIKETKNQPPEPAKKFSIEEIQKGNNEKQAYIVIKERVYDVTKLLDIHPGGKRALLSQAGKLDPVTTDEFESIHNDSAKKWSQSYLVGGLDDIAKKYLEDQKKKGKEPEDDTLAIRKHSWTEVEFTDRKELSKDTRQYTFKVPDVSKKLGLQTGQHLQIGYHFLDSLVFRSYTPTRPIYLDPETGTFDLVVKTYFPQLINTPPNPGGTISNILDCLRKGQRVEVKGPTGDMLYQGDCKFKIDGQGYMFEYIYLICGGSGITPAYQLIRHVLEQAKTLPKPLPKLCLVYSNTTENDILLRGDLEDLAMYNSGQFKLILALSKPPAGWTDKPGHEAGRVSEAMLRKYDFTTPPKVALLCGPEKMIKDTVIPALKNMGYDEKDMFGF